MSGSVRSSSTRSMLLRDRGDGLTAPLHVADREAFPFERPDQRLRDRRVVLDEQDRCHGASVTPPSAQPSAERCCR